MRTLLAAFMMFTRLPLWRWVEVDKSYYKGILHYWCIVGFLTGTVTWGVLWIASQVLPLLPSCILAVAARLLLTGALHEDGLADFFDGFGGGHDRESRLRIMKDSHIGSYGVIGLIVYFMLYVSLLYSLPSGCLAASIIAADVLSKLITAAMIDTLPYARTEETSKTKVLYSRLNYIRFNLITAGCAAILFFIGASFWGLIPALAVSIGLRFYFKRKLNGYTGDCCGAAVLFTETAFYIGTLIACQL